MVAHQSYHSISTRPPTVIFAYSYFIIEHGGCCVSTFSRHSLLYHTLPLLHLLLAIGSIKRIMYEVLSSQRDAVLAFDRVPDYLL